MRKHCYEQVDKLVQPIMDFMREEYPNDCKMVISADFYVVWRLLYEGVF